MKYFLFILSFSLFSQTKEYDVQFKFVGETTESFNFKTKVYPILGSYQNEDAAKNKKNNVAMDLTPTTNPTKSDIIWSFDLQAGTVSVTSNYTVIPSGTGSRIDLDTTTALSYRVYLSAMFKKKHQIRLLFAPLQYNSDTFIPTEDLLFNGIRFLAGVPTQTEYKFNSYRLTYMYHFDSWGKIKFRVGLAAKIRDAYTGVKQDSRGVTSRFTDLGFVPLLHIGAIFTIDEKSFLDLEAEGSWAPQGYAVDARASYNYHLSKKISLGLGIGFLDGGADVPSVTTFTTAFYGFGRFIITL